MKYKIEYEEQITRCNTVTINVENEAEGEEITKKLSISAGRWNHPDDILCVLKEMGRTVREMTEGVETVSYEI